MHAKAVRLQKELDKEREQRHAQEVEDAKLFCTLHLWMKELSSERDDLKKILTTTRIDLKGTLSLSFTNNSVCF